MPKYSNYSDTNENFEYTYLQKHRQNIENIVMRQ